MGKSSAYSWGGAGQNNIADIEIDVADARLGADAGDILGYPIGKVVGF